MLFEEIYDSFLTLSKKNNRDYKFVMNMLKRTLKDIDDKIILYYHDYSRIKGEKLKLNREKYEKAFGVNKDLAYIKIEEGNCNNNNSGINDNNNDNDAENNNINGNPNNNTSLDIHNSNCNENLNIEQNDK